jgi:GT2 family glycosyltransferase/glycosyltransferase involved in cell wall biosynthesis
MDARSEPVLGLWGPVARQGPELSSGTAGLADCIEGVAESPAEALKRASEQYPGRDVLVLRVDAELPSDGLRRLLAAHQDGHWDVLSPIDGRWKLFPDHLTSADRDSQAWLLGEHASFSARRWSSICSLWRADAVARTTDANLRIGLLPCLYVGPALEPDTVELPLPLATLHSRMAARTTPVRARVDRPVLLHVLHDWGGGVERFARDLAAGDEGRLHLMLVAHADEYRMPYGRRLCLYLDMDTPPVRTWSLANPIPDTAEASPEVESILACVIAEWGVSSVLVSSLIGHSLDVLRTGLPTAFCVHDTYPVWPVLHDSRDPRTSCLDEAELARTLSSAGPAFLFSGREAASWWSLRRQLVLALDTGDATLVAPSEFARDRLCALVPEFTAMPWQVIPHGLAPLATAAKGWAPSQPDAPLRVLVPGRLDGGKGEHLLMAMLATLPPDVELLLLGSGSAGARFEGKSRVTVERDYRRELLADRVQGLAPDIALLPSTVPETFSYVLSEMWALGVPVLCAAPGAPTERVRATGAGWTVAAEPGAVNAMLASLAADRAPVIRLRLSPPPVQPDLATMATAWSQVLPPVHQPLRLATASPGTLSTLGLLADVGRLEKRLSRREQELAEAWLELDRRAAWAQGLQQALAIEKQRASDPASEIRRLEQYIAELDHELAEAHGYYQRDSNDLARQRDIAVFQRDEAEASLHRIRGSLFWRATALPRAVLGRVRNRLLAVVYYAHHWRSLAARGLASLRARGLMGTWRRFAARRSPPGHARLLSTPSASSGSQTALRLPRPKRPTASIVIPVYNQLHFTLACLRSLSDCGDIAEFEVILVDDCSSDASPNVLPSVPGLRYHRNQANLGFIGACNAGAELATGEFLVFLNNDTTVQPGWLDALLSTFERYPDTGLAGSKLVYPDGRLQEAGGIVFADGSGYNYGRFEDPAHPRYEFVREVDYCSGAAIALRRSRFLALGGFDSHYAPAYYEDTDLAMRVRELGLKVRYQPASVVVHHEGVSSGTDLGQGVKRFQQVNHKKFLARWETVLRNSHAPPGTDPELASERGRRRRVLVLDACTPTPDRDSGSVRMLALMKVLREEGCAVSFFPENRAHDGDYTRQLQQLGIEAWWHPWLGDVPRWLAAHGRQFDLVIVSRHYVLSPVLPLLRSLAPKARLVFDTVDLHHLREQREADISGDPGLLRAAARTRRIEHGLITGSDLTWVVSGVEKALLAEELPGARVEVVSNIHEVQGAGLPWSQRSDLLFVGSYRHPPNVDAAVWLATTIFPLVRERLPDVVLNLVGGDAPESVKGLGALPGVRFHDYVPDLVPMLQGCRVGVAPLRYGAGVKGKVNQSLAHGQPMVATACAVEGMYLVDGEDVLVADDPQAFADAVVRLYQDESLWQRLSEGGMENTRRHFSPEAVRQTVRGLLDSLPPR